MGLFKKKTEEEKERQQQKKLTRKLIEACREKNTEKMREILAAGANPNGEGWTRLGRSEAKYLVSALGLCAYSGFIGGMKLLLEECGADINLDVAGTGTALHKAAEAGNGESTQYLVSRGVDVNIKNSSMDTAADVAESKGYIGIANYLREEGYQQKLRAGIVNNNDNWSLMMEDTVAHTHEDRQTGIRLTECFNFRVEKRLSIVAKMDGEVLNYDLTPFTDVQEGPMRASVATAEAQLKRLGGIAPKVN